MLAIPLHPTLAKLSLVALPRAPTPPCRLQSGEELSVCIPLCTVSQCLCSLTLLA